MVDRPFRHSGLGAIAEIRSYCEAFGQACLASLRRIEQVESGRSKQRLGVAGDWSRDNQTEHGVYDNVLRIYACDSGATHDGPDGRFLSRDAEIAPVYWPGIAQRRNCVQPPVTGKARLS